LGKREKKRGGVSFESAGDEEGKEKKKEKKDGRKGETRKIA